MNTLLSLVGALLVALPFALLLTGMCLVAYDVFTDAPITSEVGPLGVKLLMACLLSLVTVAPLGFILIKVAGQ